MSSGVHLLKNKPENKEKTNEEDEKKEIKRITARPFSDFANLLENGQENDDKFERYEIKNDELDRINSQPFEIDHVQNIKKINKKEARAPLLLTHTNILRIGDGKK